jgi:hypothetical protein
MNLLTPYTHHSKLQVITALSLIYTFTVHKALGFSVFISRILATDLEQAQCHCSTHEVLFPQPNSFLDISSQSFDCHLLRLSQFFFLVLYYLVCEAIGTAATPGLLCQPRVIVKMIVEKQMQCRFVGETTVLGENLPQRHFFLFVRLLALRPLLAYCASIG